MVDFVTKERYLNPYTDFGFKKLFGSEINKDLLISFLNALLHGEQHVVDVTYLRSERLGEGGFDRKAIFDVYCENDLGEKFIVEMQKAKQKYFKDRSVYYASFPVRDQALQGDWDFKLKAVYTIGILDFVFDEDENNADYYHHEVKLMDVVKKEVFYDKLTFIYLEMPKFKKKESELVTLFDKWMYVLKNLSSLMDRPVALQERIFERVFSIAEIAQFSPLERNEYENSLKIFRDLKNVIDTAVEEASMKAKAEGYLEGEEVGIKKGEEMGKKNEKMAIAVSMKKAGMSMQQIIEITGLSPEIVDML